MYKLKLATVQWMCAHVITVRFDTKFIGKSKLDIQWEISNYSTVFWKSQSECWERTTYFLCGLQLSIYHFSPAIFHFPWTFTERSRWSDVICETFLSCQFQAIVQHVLCRTVDRKRCKLQIEICWWGGIELKENLNPLPPHLCALQMKFHSSSGQKRYPMQQWSVRMSAAAHFRAFDLEKSQWNIMVKLINDRTRSHEKSMLDMREKGSTREKESPTISC